MDRNEDIREMIRTEIQSISVLEERIAFKEMMEGVFLNLYEKNARMRFGVGGDFPKGHQVEYVLGEWTDEETNIFSFSSISFAGKSLCILIGIKMLPLYLQHVVQFVLTDHSDAEFLRLRKLASRALPREDIIRLL